MKSNRVAGRGQTPDVGGVRWPTFGAAAAIALTLRLWNLAGAPFILDEPIFLGAAREQLLSGNWIAASPIEGTQGIRYGPTVFWFYSAVQWVAGDDPRVAIVAMCLLLTGTQVLLARAATNLFRGGTTMFLLLFGLVLSSPYLHFWSRLAWDQTVLVCVAAVVVVLCGPPVLRRSHAVIVGALLGLAASSHLMVLPFAVAVVAVIVWELRADVARCVQIVGTLGLTALVVNIPYLLFLADHPPSPSDSSRGLGSTIANLAETPAVSTSFGIEYFFDGDWHEFTRWLGFAEPLLRGRAAVVVLVAMAAIVGLVTSWRSEDVRHRRIARLAVVTWVGAALVFAVRGVEQQPHYQFATWWVAPIGLAGALRFARLQAELHRAVLVASTVVVAQLGFVLAWTGFVDERSGTRGVHYGAPIGEQIDAVRTICARVTDGSAVVVNETEVFAESLEYLVLTTPSCDDIRVRVCAADTCDSREVDSSPLRLVYRDTEGAALLVVAGPPEATGS